MCAAFSPLGLSDDVTLKSLGAIIRPWTNASDANFWKMEIQIAVLLFARLLKAEQRLFDIWRKSCQALGNFEQPTRLSERNMISVLFSFCTTVFGQPKGTWIAVKTLNFIGSLDKGSLVLPHKVSASRVENLVLYVDVISAFYKAHT